MNRNSPAMKRSLLLCAVLTAAACARTTTRPLLPDSIAVSPKTARVAVGDTLQLAAQVLAVGDRPLEGFAVAWSSPDSVVATIDANGLLTARSPGLVTISASTSGITGTAAITVVSKPVLTVVKGGGGGGRVTSNPAGVDCGAACGFAFAPGAAVALSAVADAGSTFVGWGGACSGSGACALTLNADTQVTATFVSGERLTVTVTGPGAVSSTPSGLSCSSGSCSAIFPAGQPISLTATPTAGAAFGAWGGACDGAGTCTVTLSAAGAVTANFHVVHTLTTHLVGQGTVSAAGLSCAQPSCTTAFADGTALTLAATPAGGWAFGGYSGACSGTTCTLSLSQDLDLTATFVPVHLLTVTVAGDGAGAIASVPAGISCSSGSCTAPFVEGTTITLSATSAGTAVFGGWGGACSGNAGCSITLSADASATATFSAAQTLSVTVQGTGNGTVISTPAGIACASGRTCSARFLRGTTVGLAAQTGSHTAFLGFSGDCTAVPCSVSLATDHAVTASFATAYQLTVNLTGNGAGSIASSAAGLSCSGSVCTGGFVAGTALTLTATPQAGTRFAGWSGDCTGTGACPLTMNADFTEAASLVQISTLTAGVTGSGSVAPTTSEWSCTAASCPHVYDTGAVITLHAAPATSWTFHGWSGDGLCSGTSDCGFALGADHTVSAAFQPQLALTVTGSGSVSVNNAAPCTAGTCTQDFAPGTSLSLVATPQTGFQFLGWSGGSCSGAATTCSFPLNAPVAVTAAFAKVHTLTVTLGGSGTGTVASAPLGFTCSAVSCTKTNIPDGTSITLGETPDSGSIFQTWGNACSSSGTASSCTFTLNADLTVSASFALVRTLTIAMQGGGLSGFVSDQANAFFSCSYDGTNTSGTCSRSFIQGTNVSLVAQSDTLKGWFTGFSSNCATQASANNCKITLLADQTVTATFVPVKSNLLSVNYNKADAITDGQGLTGTGLAARPTTSQYYSGYQVNSTLTLTATPVAGDMVTWSEDCSAALTNLSCTLAMTADHRATATFTLAPAPTTAPAAPTGLGATAGSLQVTLAWTPNASNQSVTSYNVYYAQQAGVTKANYATLTGGTKVASSTAGAHLTGLTASTAYHFVVTAVNSKGESVESAEVASTPTP